MALILAFMLRWQVAGTFQAKNESMEPIIKAGSYLMVSADDSLRRSDEGAGMPHRLDRHACLEARAQPSLTIILSARRIIGRLRGAASRRMALTARSISGSG